MKLPEIADGDWYCFCGNADIERGFSFCDASGERVRQHLDDCDGDLLVCNRCGRVIYAELGVVVGFAHKNKLSEWERYEILVSRIYDPFPPR
jgi:hypothetical protein